MGPALADPPQDQQAREENADGHPELGVAEHGGESRGHSGCSAKWQAASCPGATSRNAGGSVRQRASFFGCGQRGWNGQPGGGCAGDGTSPASTMRCRWALGSGTGTAESSDVV